MDLTNFLAYDEKPLDRIVDDGGFTAIFRTIACVGDSLSSGEFESNIDGVKGFHDMFDYSWGQYIARATGAKVYNFSRGGMTAAGYFNTYANQCCCWNPEFAAQAYTVALGVNDAAKVEKGADIYPDGWGSIDDIAENYKDNKKSFYGYYAAIIQRYKTIQPQAKFFLINRPRSCEFDERAEALAKAVSEIAEKLDNCFVIDLYNYAPIYDGEFRKLFYLGGHMNPMGYILTAKMVMSYIDFIIRHNYKEFIQVPFIGTGLKNVTRYPYKDEE